MIIEGCVVNQARRGAIVQWLGSANTNGLAVARNLGNKLRNAREHVVNGVQLLLLNGQRWLARPATAGERFRFEPNNGVYRVVGSVAVPGLLMAGTAPDRFASPAGFEPVGFPAARGVWARADWARRAWLCVR
jgi:hypothetical protein